MKISVVVATYNGEQYIEEQLLSIKDQTRRADEVLIIDDCSKDATVEIISSFIKKYSLSGWSLVKNKENKGYKRNFIEGMKMSTGDIIFPCDQDDIWHLDKLERMSKIIEDNSDIYVLAGKPHKWFDNRIESDESVRIKFGKLLDKLGSEKSTDNNSVTIKYFDQSFMKCMPGCVLAVQREYLNSVFAEWYDSLPHDKLLVFYARIQDHYYEYDHTVIEWRIHNESTTHTGSRNRLSRLNELSVEKTFINQLYKYSNRVDVRQSYRKIMKEAMIWNENRYQLVHNHSISAFFKLIHYRNFYVQKRRILTDLIYGMKHER